MEKNCCKVLLVDDSENDRILFDLAFRRAQPPHLRITTVLGSGDEAIMYLAGEGRFADRAIYPLPDLLVLDLKMPGCTGFDVLRWIHDHSLSLLTVVHSDSTEHDDIERAMNLGANDYQKKARDLLGMADWLRCLDESWARWHAGSGWRRNSS